VAQGERDKQEQDIKQLGVVVLIGCLAIVVAITLIYAALGILH